MSASISQLAFPFDERQLSRSETPKVEETAVCSETDVDDVWQVLFCLTEHDGEEDGEQYGGQDERIPA